MVTAVLIVRFFQGSTAQTAVCNVNGGRCTTKIHGNSWNNGYLISDTGRQKQTSQFYLRLSNLQQPWEIFQLSSKLISVSVSLPKLFNISIWLMEMRTLNMDLMAAYMITQGLHHANKTKAKKRLKAKNSTIIHVFQVRASYPWYYHSVLRLKHDTFRLFCKYFTCEKALTMKKNQCV